MQSERKVSDVRRHGREGNAMHVSGGRPFEANGAAVRCGHSYVPLRFLKERYRHRVTRKDEDCQFRPSTRSCGRTGRGTLFLVRARARSHSP